MTGVIRLEGKDRLIQNKAFEIGATLWSEGKEGRHWARSCVKLWPAHAGRIAFFGPPLIPVFPLPLAAQLIQVNLFEIKIDLIANPARLLP